MHNPVSDKYIFKPLPAGLNTEYDRWLVSPFGSTVGGNHREWKSWLKWKKNTNPKRVLDKDPAIGFRIARNK